MKSSMAKTLWLTEEAEIQAEKAYIKILLYPLQSIHKKEMKVKDLNYENPKKSKLFYITVTCPLSYSK